jgi:hypothetical protein
VDEVVGDLDAFERAPDGCGVERVAGDDLEALPRRDRLWTRARQRTCSPRSSSVGRRRPPT